MNNPTTRRGFVRTAVTAGGLLAIGGVKKVAPAAQPAENQPVGLSSGRADLVDGSRGIGSNAPLLVIMQSVSRDVRVRGVTWMYITEILQRAGLFYEQRFPDGVPSLLRHEKPVVLLAGDLRLTPVVRDTLANSVWSGGSLVGIGGTSGLDRVFGVTSHHPLAEGWMKVTAEQHPVTAGLHSSLHVFGGCAVTTGSATSLAGLESGRQGAKGSAIVENCFGKGRAILLAPDLIFSIVHIQQGLPVYQDGSPAPDGSAAIDDGELKAEDGLVLDWQQDRTPMQPDGVPAFLEPVTDELREVILRSIFHVAGQQGVALPVLWYWPRGLKAVGHISHDTDGHDPRKATALLKVLNRASVKSTWCTLYPGGYPKGLYCTLKEQDCEIALHYDARSGGLQTSWSIENLVFQHGWLMKEASLEHIASNKNHYTRWEGRLDFLRWCEQIGINADQTRGPSKRGAIGFPLGGSQPYFPLDDEAESPRLLNVLEVNMLTQDLVVVCPAECGRQLAGSVLRHHGVAHFLFHPAHILETGVADAFCDLVDYGRAEGLEWWTNRQIYDWEMLRRSLKATFDSHTSLALHAAKRVPDATLLFLKPPAGPQSIIINGKPAQTDVWSLYGFQFDAVTLDVDGRLKVRIA